MIKVTDLTLKHKDAIILDGISFTVGKGEILGIVGDKDSGKSTLMEIISGALDASSGSVEICGYDISSEPMQAKRRIGYMPERMSFYESMTVLEYLTFCAEARDVPYQRVQECVKDALTSTGLVAARSVIISRLNTLARCKLGLAQAVVSNPEVLLLDGINCGLTESESEEICALTQKLARSRATLITSRGLAIGNICDKMLTLSFGHIDYNYHSDTRDVGEDA